MASARALRAGKAIIELSLISTDVEKQLKRLEMKMKNFGKAMSSIGSAGLKLSGSLAGLLAFPIKMAADLEKTRAEFSALIGDATQANKLVSDIEGLALVSPLGTADLSAAARTLLGFGVSLDDIMPRLKQMGDISGGDAERLGRLALAFGQMTGKGRLMGQELNQMIEQGFNPLQEISRKTGESIGDLQKRMEAGGLSASEVGDAFQSVTGEGGRFQGMMASIAGTTIGKFNELKESIAVAIRPIGDALLPLLNEYMEAIKGLVPRIAEWIKENTSTIQSVGKLTVGIGAASLALVAIGKVIEKSSITVGVLGKAISFLYAHPVLMGLAAVAEGFHSIATAATAAEKAAAAANSFGGFATTPSIDKDKLWGSARKVNHGSPMTLGLGAAMLEAGLPSVGDSNNSNSTIDMNAISTSISTGAKTALMGIQQAINKETSIIPVWVDGVKMHIDRARDLLTEQESIDDEIARTKIQAMEDEVAKEKALIGLETKIRMRELQDRGLLTDEIRGKLLELQGAQLGAVGLNAPEDRMRDQQALFDSRFAAQMFGGGRNEELNQLRQIARNTKPQNNQGIAVV